MSDDEGRTSWFIPGATCPKCGSPVCSDGRTEWCAVDGCGYEIEVV